DLKYLIKLFDEFANELLVYHLILLLWKKQTNIIILSRNIEQLKEYKKSIVTELLNPIISGEDRSSKELVQEYLDFNVNDSDMIIINKHIYESDLLVRLAKLNPANILEYNGNIDTSNSAKEVKTASINSCMDNNTNSVVDIILNNESVIHEAFGVISTCQND
ncbi:hypothetical protein COBT_002182, partial [Conglomerata obtusa]